MVQCVVLTIVLLLGMRIMETMRCNFSPTVWRTAPDTNWSRSAILLSCYECVVTVA